MPLKVQLIHLPAFTFRILQHHSLFAFFPWRPCRSCFRCVLSEIRPARSLSNGISPSSSSSLQVSSGTGQKAPRLLLVNVVLRVFFSPPRILFQSLTVHESKPLDFTTDFASTKAAGAFEIVAAAAECLALCVLVFASAHFPLQRPIGDLSQIIKGASKSKKSVEHHVKDYNVQKKM